MKILHIAFTFGYGGIETMLANIANAQVDFGHKVSIIIIEDVVEPRLVESLHHDIRLHFCHRKCKKDLFALARLNYFLILEQPNAIHLHSSSAFRLLMPQFRAIANSTTHDMPYEANTRYVEQIPRRFAISQSVHDALLKLKGVESIVNPNGIRPELIKAKVGLLRHEGLFRIVQVSRLMHEKKGQDILIRACAILKESGYKNFHVDFIGEGLSLDYLTGLCKDCQVDEMVSFLGAKDQRYIFDHLCEYDLFVQPSRLEGFGLTVAESMAAKVPVLVSNNEGPAEIIENGRFGYLFRSGDEEDCAQKIAYFLDGMADAMKVEKAYERVLTMYNVKETAARYVSLYVSTLSKKE